MKTIQTLRHQTNLSGSYQQKKKKLILVAYMEFSSLPRDNLYDKTARHAIKMHNSKSSQDLLSLSIVSSFSRNGATLTSLMNPLSNQSK